MQLTRAFNEDILPLEILLPSPPTLKHKEIEKGS